MDNNSFEKLSSRKYKTFDICQLDGCEKKLIGRNKYCCDKHAEEAKKIYRREWEKRNPDRKKQWNKNYYNKKNASKNNQPKELQKPSIPNNSVWKN